VNRVQELARDGLWTLEDDNRLVGALVVGDAPSYVPTAVVDELYVLLVLTSRGRAGEDLGGRLLDKAEDLAREGECSVMRVDCWAGAPDLIRWYERKGFTRTDTFEVNGWKGQVLQRSL
jgi:GNAT superfamily N-acetyltransferase